jgi:hypothetical protein
MAAAPSQACFSRLKPADDGLFLGRFARDLRALAEVFREAAGP